MTTDRDVPDFESEPFTEGNVAIPDVESTEEPETKTDERESAAEPESEGFGFEPQSQAEPFSLLFPESELET